MLYIGFQPPNRDIELKVPKVTLDHEPVGNGLGKHKNIINLDFPSPSNSPLNQRKLLPIDHSPQKICLTPDFLKWSHNHLSQSKLVNIVPNVIIFTYTYLIQTTAIIRRGRSCSW